MVDKTSVETSNDESKQKVDKISKNIIEPALQKLLADARKEGSAEEVMSAMVNSYAGLLVDVIGIKAAASLMRDHARHIASLEE